MGPACLTLSSPPLLSSLLDLEERREPDLAAVGSRRMLFPNCAPVLGAQEMQPSRPPPGVADMGLGLQSLRLSEWDRTWSSSDTEPLPQVQTTPPSGKYRSSELITWRWKFLLLSVNGLSPSGLRHGSR